MLDDEDQQATQTVDEETQQNNDLDSSQSYQTQRTSITVAVLNKKTIRPFQDEFLSDDDEPVIIQPETRLITLIGLLERLFHLLNQCHQLIHDMRNIGVVQAYITMEIGGKECGFSVDMDVSFSF